MRVLQTLSLELSVVGSDPGRGVLNFVVRAVHCRGFLSRRATRSATRRDIGATRHKVAQPTTCPSSP